VTPPSAKPGAADAAASGTTAIPAPKVASALPPEPEVSPSSAAAAVPPPQVATPAGQAAGTTTGTNANQLASVAPPSAPIAGNGAAVPTEAIDTVGPGASAPMVIQATADAWIEIKTAQGRVLYQNILHPGDKYTVPDQPALTLTTGNAGGTEVVLSGNVIGPLKGRVLRNIPLDPDSLKAASGITPSAPAAGTTTGTDAGPSPVGTAPAAQ